MPRALILAGTGAIGRATADRLLRDGWQVEVTGRDPGHLPVDLRAARFSRVDNDDPAAGGQLLALLGAGADLVVDCACFTAADARRLLLLADRSTTTVMISSKAVYVDAAGNHSNSDTAPCFPVPIREDQPTLEPASGGSYSSREGYGPHKVAAERVLLDAARPVTVLRASKVHGAGARRPRTWVFVKRALDARPALLLTDRGRGVDHPGAAVNTAELILLVSGLPPAARLLNVADPDAPTVLDISRAVAAAMDHTWQEVLLAAGSGGGLGGSPWDAPHPVVLDTGAAVALGHRPVGSFAETVTEEVRWLVAAARGGPDAELVPSADDAFFRPLLDYAAEDRFLASMR